MNREKEERKGIQPEEGETAKKAAKEVLRQDQVEQGDREGRS